MARQRQWYEEVMDVALRATLKEHGFKRKSHTTYVCEHSPDRVWRFKLSLCHSPAEHFSEYSGIFVQAIEDLLSRHTPEFADIGILVRPLLHSWADIGDLVKIENGWNAKAWNQNPRSRTWLGGYRNSPSIDTVLRHIQPGGCFTYDAAGSAMGISSQKWRRRIKTITEELGHDLDMLWRKYELDWLQRCDDPLFFAEWTEQHVYRGCNLQRAAAYHLAGADDRAAAALRRDVEEAEIPYEVMVERMDVRERGDPRWRWLHGDQGKTREYVENSTRRWMDARKRDADAARKLANGLGIKL
ncbi:MAG: hypothetical protein OEZ03_08200 [Alphaproteobacteria bacterium]|nr:hypothetical protein [Alphaproteobacteria bacterium]MDH5557317.1 hypothetical protein [Alphaproteobacteria bacterium]